MLAYRNAMQTQSVEAQIRKLDNDRRRNLLIPALITMSLLVSSGYLPALYPVVTMPMLVSLSIILVVMGITYLFNRARRVTISSTLYVLSALAFYAVAVFLVPSNVTGQLSYQNFTAGNLYYFLADVLPIFGASFLLDLPWIISINAIIAMINGVAIWLLPHDATFNTFTQHLGGPLFLTASVTLGQVVLIVFGVAASRTLQNSLVEASRATTLEIENERIAERQRILKQDIEVLQKSHSYVANRMYSRVELSPSSEVYPLAVSMNLMIDRLSQSRRAEEDFSRIQYGLDEIARVINGLNTGNLIVHWNPTNSPVDAILAMLVNAQGQIVSWIQSMNQGIQEVGMSHYQAVQLCTELVQLLHELQRAITPSPTGVLKETDLRDLIQVITKNTEQMNQLLATISLRERLLLESVNRINIQ